MSNYTEHYNLKKPLKTESYDVEVANTNNNIIDEKIYGKVDKIPGKGLSSNDFTNNYKSKLDSLQYIYKYRGSVNTYNELSAIDEKHLGDVYNVIDTSKNYSWNNEEWIELGTTINIEELAKKSDYYNKSEVDTKVNSTKEEIEKKIKNQRLKLEGKSEQDGTPSPDNIVPIRNVGDNINLFDKDNVNIISGYLSANTQKIYKNSTYKDKMLYIKCRPNTTYTISKKQSSRFSTCTADEIITTAEKNISNATANNTSTSITITSGANDNYLYVFYYTNGDNEQEILNSIKIEQGSIATPYTPYGCGSIDYKIENADKTESKNIHFQFTEGQLLHEGDYVDSTGIHQKKKTYVFTGTENFELITISNNIAQISLTINDIIISIDKEERYIISNYFKGIKWNNSWLYDNSITVMPINKKIVILSSTYTTIETLKTWLVEQYANGTPLTIEYKLAEEIVTPLTQEQIEAYYELQKAKYVDNMTLTCLNEIEPTILDIDKKLEESLLDVEKLLAILKLNS